MMPFLNDFFNIILQPLGGMVSEALIRSIAETLAMFVFIFSELTVLFLLISFGVSLIQFYIGPDVMRKIMSGRRSYFIAALLGAVTPFCSCSTIPFLKGLIRAKCNFGGVFVFLLSSPLLNPIVMGLFAVSFGVKVSVYYFFVAMFFSVFAGFVWEMLGFERFVVDTIDSEDSCDAACTGSSCERGSTKNKSLDSFRLKLKSAWTRSWSDFQNAFRLLLISVTIGAIIYGFVPEGFIETYAGGDNIYSVPVAATIGIPLYIRASAVIPITLSLVEKGMQLGTVVAFIIGSSGASLTEVILLRNLFRKPIIFAFLFTVLAMAILSGYLLPVFI